MGQIIIFLGDYTCSFTFGNTPVVQIIYFVLNTCTYFGCYPWNENTWHIIQDVKHGHFFTAEIPTIIQQDQSLMERLDTNNSYNY